MFGLDTDPSHPKLDFLQGGRYSASPSKYNCTVNTVDTTYLERGVCDDPVVTHTDFSCRESHSTVWASVRDLQTSYDVVACNFLYQ